MNAVLLLTTALFLPLGAKSQIGSQANSQQPWFVAAQLSNHRFEVVVPGKVPGLTGTAPYQFTVGYWVSPQWAVQMDYSSQHFLNERTAYGISTTGNQISKYLYVESHTRALFTSARRQLTRKQGHRVQFDALVGGGFVHYRDSIAIVNKTDGRITSKGGYSDQANNFYLALSPALTFRFNRHFEGCFELLFTKNLNNIGRSYSTQVLNSTLGFQRGFNLGLRYRFNLPRRLAPATISSP